MITRAHVMLADEEKVRIQEIVDDAPECDEFRTVAEAKTFTALFR